MTVTLAEAQKRAFETWERAALDGRKLDAIRIFRTEVVRESRRRDLSLDYLAARWAVGALAAAGRQNSIGEEKCSMYSCPVEPCLVCGEDCCTLEADECLGPQTHDSSVQLLSGWACSERCWEIAAESP